MEFLVYINLFDNAVLNKPEANTVFCIFRDYIGDMLDSEKKFICFAHHKVVIDGICEVLNGKEKE
jgi:hypothetical protein